MKICIQPKFGCKRITDSKDIIETFMLWLYIYIYKPSLWPWTWRWQPIFLHDTPHRNEAPTYQVWLRKVEWFQRYHLDKAPQLCHSKLWPCSFKLNIFWFCSAAQGRAVAYFMLAVQWNWGKAGSSSCNLCLLLKIPSLFLISLHFGRCVHACVCVWSILLQNHCVCCPRWSKW